jgi:hypothetical protein
MNPSTLKLFEDVLRLIGVVVVMGCMTGILTTWFKWGRPRRLLAERDAAPVLDRPRNAPPAPR